MIVPGQKPKNRSIAPTRRPNIEVDADNRPSRIYPATTPILRGV